jgi:hypothetical protein
MRSHALILGLFFCVTSNFAHSLSTRCDDCYEKKMTCNSEKSHSFNSCDHELMACKASCVSGRPQGVYHESSFEVAFKPILGFDRNS